MASILGILPKVPYRASLRTTSVSRLSPHTHGPTAVHLRSLAATSNHAQATRLSTRSSGVPGLRNSQVARFSTCRVDDLTHNTQHTTSPDAEDQCWECQQPTRWTIHLSMHLSEDEEIKLRNYAKTFLDQEVPSSLPDEHPNGQQFPYESPRVAILQKKVTVELTRSLSIGPQRVCFSYLTVNFPRIIPRQQVSTNLHDLFRQRPEDYRRYHNESLTPSAVTTTNSASHQGWSTYDDALVIELADKVSKEQGIKLCQYAQEFLDEVAPFIVRALDPMDSTSPSVTRPAGPPKLTAKLDSSDVVERDPRPITIFFPRNLPGQVAYECLKYLVEQHEEFGNIRTPYYVYDN